MASRTTPPSLLSQMTVAALLSLVKPQSLAQSTPKALRLYFDSGSTRISKDQQFVLAKAVRLFHTEQPYVMVVAGSADRTGNPASNLMISLQRAQAVAEALLERGIPSDRLQVLGRGNSDLPEPTSNDVDEQRNRVVEITWR